MPKLHQLEYFLLEGCYRHSLSPELQFTMRFAVVCVAVAIFALGYSQRPAPCATPSVWSGFFFRADPTQNFYEQAEIIYDALNQRIALTEIQDIRGSEELYRDILLYEEEKGYRINLKTKSCQTFRLNDPFRPFAIPNNATSDGYIFVPSSVSGAGVEAVIWSGNTTDPVGRYSIMVTADACIPVNEQFYSDRTGVVQTFFFNIIIGDINPDIFIPPSGCTPTK